MGRPVVKENGKQLKRDDSYSLWKQVLGFSFNCYHLPDLYQYSHPWGPINKGMEGPMGECTNTRQKAFSVYNSAAWLAWVRPDHPFPLQFWFWVQEGDFSSPGQKSQGGSGFGDHTSKGQGDPTHTFTLWCGDEQTTAEKGEVLKNHFGEWDCWDNDLKSRRKCPPHTESTCGLELRLQGGMEEHFTQSLGHHCQQWPFCGRSAVLHPGSVALAHSQVLAHFWLSNQWWKAGCPLQCWVNRWLTLGRAAQFLYSPPGNIGAKRS